MKTPDKTSFTAGPWDQMESRTLIHIETANTGSGPCGRHICSVPKSDKANAALIASAPELYRALEAASLAIRALVDGDYSPADIESAYTQARAALSLALNS